MKHYGITSMLAGLGLSSGLAGAAIVTDGPQSSGTPAFVKTSRDARLYHKEPGSGKCRCGRTISANKWHCRACGLRMEAARALKLSPWNDAGWVEYEPEVHTSPCHWAPVDLSRGDGVTMGTCRQCRAVVVRINPKTQKQEIGLIEVAE